LDADAAGTRLHGYCFFTNCPHHKEAYVNKTAVIKHINDHSPAGHVQLPT